MTASQAVKGILGFFSLGLGFYQSYLILKTIHATDVMWLIWAMLVPLAITLTAIGLVADNERIDKRVRELLRK